MFVFFDYVMKQGLPANQYGPAILPIIFWSLQDLSSVWKSLGKGGGAKLRKHFCHLCPCLSANILFAKEDANRCNRCIQHNKPKCYHWKVCDEDTIPLFQEELRVEMDYYLIHYRTSIAEVSQQTNLVYDPSALNKFVDPKNIEFTPRNATEHITFGSLMFAELELRKLPLGGTFEEKRLRLREALINEERISLIQQALDRSKEGREAALILMKQAVPCILHYEN